MAAAAPGPGPKTLNPLKVLEAVCPPPPQKIKAVGLRAVHLPARAVGRPLGAERAA